MYRSIHAKLAVLFGRLQHELREWHGLSGTQLLTGETTATQWRLCHTCQRRAASLLDPDVVVDLLSSLHTPGVDA